jgi:hypothetical protein
MAIRQTQAGHWVGTIKIENATITTAGPSRSVVYAKLIELLEAAI